MVHTEPETKRIAADRLEFGPFQLDVSGRSLYRSGEFVAVTPKVLETLLVLVQEAGRVVTKEQLFARVWPDAAVEEGNITNNISTLRKILNPYFEGEGPIATVARRGYRFTAGVRLRNAQADIALQSPLPAGVATPAATRGPASAASRVLTAAAALVACAVLLSGLAFRQRTGPSRVARRSVAVLPMKNLSEQPQSGWLSTALTETIGAELVSSGEVRLVSGESLARMQQQLQPPPGVGLSRKQLEEIGRNLGCDLILSGNYLTIDGKIRVDVRLDDVATGEPLAAVSATREESALLDLVALAGGELRSKLGLAPTLAGQTQPARASFSAKPEAMRAYIQGLEALRLREGPRARDLLASAVLADPDFALAHSALSNTWRLLGYDRRGAEAAKRAFELSARLSREDRLSVEAQYYEASSNWTKATLKYRSLWEFFPDNVEYGLKLANVQQLGGKLEDSLRVVQQMRALPGPDGADPRIDLLEATVAERLADYPRATRVVAQAVEKAKATKSNLLLARARIKQAIYANRQGQPEQARAYAAEARQIFESAGETGGVADALRWDGLVLVQRGQLDEGERQLGAALKLSTRLDYVRLTTQILLSQADAALRRGALPAAKTASEGALAAAREADNQSAIAGALTNLGIVLKRQGDYAAARTRYEEAARISRELGERNSLSIASNNIALIDLAQGRLADARRGIEELIPTERKIGNKSTIANRLGNLSQVLRQQGDLAGAKQLAVEECSLHEALGAKTNLAACRTRLALLSMDEGRAADARGTTDKVSAADLKTVPLYLSKLASVQRELGEPAKAAATLAEVRKLMRGRSSMPEETLPIDIDAARADAAAGRGAAAVQRLARVQTEAQKLGMLTVVLEARLAAAEVAARSGDRSQALLLARDAEQHGFGLIAAKARALAGGGPLASVR